MDEKANLLNFKDEFEVYNYSRNYIDVCREYLNDRKKYKINFKKTKYRIIYDFGSAWPGGGGGTPIHYLYGYVPPNGGVILKLLI